MIIDDYQREKEGDVVRLRARVRWEETTAAPMVLFFETDAQAEAVFSLDPCALLTICLLPAWRAGERRVRLEGELCPVLRDNLDAATAILKSWYAPDFPSALPQIEASAGMAARRPARRRALSLLSCGIDSLATLRSNRLNLPADHPASIRSAVSLEFSHAPAAQPLASAPRFAPAAAIAAAADIDLLFVRSNAWWLVDDGYFYDEKWHGGVLAGVAGMFSSGHDKAYIASSWYPRFLCPYGSHPLLDPNYSSAHFAVEHHGLSMTRFEKTALVAEWSPALQNLRVCQRDGSGRGNCGKCEKCIGTMTTLLALGKLGECGAFAQKEVTPELLYGFKDYDGFYNDEQAQERYRELLPALAARGRDDLVAAIRNLLAYAEKKRA